MATKIYIKHGTGAPDPTDIAGAGELAIDIQNKLIYTKDLSDNVIALGADVAGSTIDWSQLDNVPSEFVPVDHTHVYDEVNNGSGKTLTVEISEIEAAIAALSTAVDALEGNLAFGGTVNMSLGTITSTATVAIDKGFVVGNIPTPPPTDSDGVYFIVEVGGLFDGKTFNSGDWLISEGDSGWQEVHFDATVAVTWDQVGGKPTEFPPSAHNHVIADVTGLQAALDDKPNNAHTHVIADVTGLQAELDGKASVVSINGGTY
jgi:hypothetical protein